MQVACQSQDGAHAKVVAELAAAPYVKAMQCWVVVSNILQMFTPKIGEDSHFD